MRTALLLFLRANRRHLAELGLSSLLINTMMLALPLFSMLVYDKAVGNQVHDTLWALSIGMVGLLAMELLMRASRVMLVEHAGARWDQFLDQHLLRGVLQAPLSRPLPAGEVVARLREVSASRDALSAQNLLGFTDLPFMLLFAAVMAWVAGPLVLIPLGLGAGLMLSGWWLQSMADDRQRVAHRASREKLSLLVDVLACRESLGAPGRAAQAQARYGQASMQASRASARARWWQQLQMQLAPFVVGIGSVAVMVGGVFRVEAQALSVGGLISANMIAMRLLSVMCTLPPLASRWREFVSALQGLTRLVDLAHTHRVAADAAPAALAAEGVRLDQLSVGFEGRAQPVLSALGLTLRTGELVALVGSSGSGKTTLLRLLAGQLAHTEGRLSVGARLVDDEGQRQWLRTQSHLKAQDPGFLGGTVREIVSGGDDTLGDDAVADALRRAGLGPALDRGEIGLNTGVGTNGTGLSGGQRQALALATAFCAPVPLLLLDEPTLGLDRAAQELVLQQLPALKPGRCVVVATHATEVIQRADRVIVLERGRVVLDGSPERLLAPLTPAAGRPAPAVPIRPVSSPA